MPDDSDPFTEAQKKRDVEVHKCELCKQIKKLSATRRIQLRDAMFGKTKVSGKRISFRVILGVVREWGIDTSQTTLNSHATGGTNANPLSKSCRESVASAWGADNGEE